MHVGRSPIETLLTAPREVSRLLVSPQDTSPGHVRLPRFSALQEECLALLLALLRSCDVGIPAPDCCRIVSHFHILLKKEIRACTIISGLRVRKTIAQRRQSLVTAGRGQSWTVGGTLCVCVAVVP